MRNVFGALTLAFGLLSAPSAMAIHTCGQLLGSCMAHTLPTPIPQPQPVVIAPIVVEPAK